jgi:DNA-binding MarR family transcriptional regulator
MREQGKHGQVIRKQRKVIELLDGYGLDLRSWETLITVAQFEGWGFVDMLPKTTISKSAFSRYIQYLSGQVFKLKNSEEVESGTLWDMVNKPLIDARPDAHDYRKKNLYLSRHGEDLLYKINALLAD